MFSVKIEHGKLEKVMQGISDAIGRGVSNGMSAAINKIEGEIRTKKIGSRVLPKASWRKRPRPTPPSGQVLWIRSGDLRNTSFGSWRSKFGQGGMYSAQVPMGDNLAIGFMQTAQPYGETLEAGKYPWASPTMAEMVEDGTVTGIIDKYINVERAKL